MQANPDRKFYMDAAKPDALAIAAAFILSILFHLGIYYAVPTEFEHIKDRRKNDELKLEILPPKITKKLPEYVEANPYANQLEPQPDSPESFTNQRAADELPDPTSKSKKPYVEGEIKDGNKIVSGTSSETDAMSPESVLDTLKRPLEQQSAHAETQEPQSRPQESTHQDSNGPKQAAQQENKQTETQNMEKSGAKESGKNETSEGASLQIIKAEKTQAPAKDSIKQAEKTSDKNSDGRSETPFQDSQRKPVQNKPQDAPPAKEQNESTKTAQDQAVPEMPKELPKPKRRPMLSMKIPAGPLADNRVRASMQGTLAVDSRFSEFGAYQQRMIEAISRQWNLIASNYDLATAVGTSVIVEFYLNVHGDLVRLKVAFSNSTNTATALCQQCILTTAPYGEWTEEMVNVFGAQDQPVRITFHYR